jgi:hypothetical protein
MAGSAAEWQLRWDRGSLVVCAMGATLMPRFDLGDGRSVAPLAVAPWCAEQIASGIEPVIANLRGEWVCVPFGGAAPLKQLAARWRGVSDEIPDGPLHGEPANGPWTLLDRGRDFLLLRYEFSRDHAIAWAERRISVDSGAAAVRCELSLMPRRAASLPIGLHPVLRLPRSSLSLILRPGPFRFGITFPYLIAEGGSRVALDRRFTDLAAVPDIKGDPMDLGRVPFEVSCEDAVQLCGTSGLFAVDNLEEGYTFELQWDHQALPSCLVWYSDRGLLDAPWNGRHRALGIEPVCSALDLGARASATSNPLSGEGEPTAVAFSKGKLWQTSYRLSVSDARLWRRTSGKPMTR